MVVTRLDYYFLLFIYIYSIENKYISEITTFMKYNLLK
jgi:hypothetical protein